MCLNFIALISMGALDRLKTGVEKEKLIKGIYNT